MPTSYAYGVVTHKGKAWLANAILGEDFLTSYWVAWGTDYSGTDPDEDTESMDNEILRFETDVLDTYVSGRLILRKDYTVLEANNGDVVKQVGLFDSATGGNLLFVGYTQASDGQAVATGDVVTMEFQFSLSGE